MSGKRFEKSFYMGIFLQGMSDILKHEIKDKQNLSAHIDFQKLNFTASSVGDIRKSMISDLLPCEI
ncbi:MAG: hypothetical protein BWK80_42055 [Desulfobacteraceae bacterium IS3]|nr:MAG: hypothetical protein BWK80_42055 [Desulfobacteraceae bacterium IS3]